MADLYGIANYILAYYGVFLTVFGTIGNLICFIVCIQKSLRQTPTYIFLAFMSLLDILNLYFWNFNGIFLIYYNMTFADLNLSICRFSFFCQCFALGSSAYILVNKYFK